MNTPEQTIFHYWTAHEANQLARKCRQSRWTDYSADDYSFYLIDQNGIHGTESPRDTLVGSVANTALHISPQTDGNEEETAEVRAEITDLLEDYYYGWGDVMGTAGAENYPTYCNIITAALAHGKQPDDEALNAAALHRIKTYSSQAEYENEAIIKFIQNRDNIEDPYETHDIDAITEETLGHIGRRFFNRAVRGFLSVVDRHSFYQ